MRRACLGIIAAGGVLLTAACGAAGGSAAPTWEASPSGIPSEGPGVQISPALPQPAAPGGTGGSGSGSPSGSPSASPSPGSKTDPQVVATKLASPIGLTMLPDGTALVGERTTGRIVRVQPVAGKPVPTVKTITGLDTAGDGGLLDLALSPDYDQDDLIYAYITTSKDNRVVEFTLSGPVTPVVTGIPKGTTGNAGRITFDADGDLLIGTGDAGHPSLAAEPTSLAGKVLRVNAIGKPVAGNPHTGSAVYTSGHDGVAGLCPVPQTATVLEVETTATVGHGGEVNRLQSGASYGFPTASGSATSPTATLPATTPVPGDCAVATGRLWVTSLDHRSLLAAPIAGTGPVMRLGAFASALDGTYGRLKTVVAASDGALWLTTSNRDGKGRPIAADERVIRYLPSAGGGAGSPV